MKIIMTVHHLPSGSIWSTCEQEVDSDQREAVESLVTRGVEEGFSHFTLQTSEGEVYLNKQIMKESVITIKEK